MKDDFLVIKGASSNLIIGVPVLVRLKARIYMYKQIVRITYCEKSETSRVKFEYNAGYDS